MARTHRNTAIWLRDGEDYQRAVCGCQLVLNPLGTGTPSVATFYCATHTVAIELREVCAQLLSYAEDAAAELDERPRCLKDARAVLEAAASVIKD